MWLSYRQLSRSQPIAACTVRSFAGRSAKRETHSALAVIELLQPAHPWSMR
jgi:hypothetical protein